MHGMGWLRKIGVAAALILAAAIVGLSIAVILYSRSDRICKGVTVAGIRVAGMTRAEAASVIDRWWSHKRREKVLLTALDSRSTWRLEDFGARIDTSKTVQAAFSIGRKGSIYRRFLDILLSRPREKRIKPAITFEKPRLVAAIKQLAKSVNRPHKDASLKVVNGRIEVQQDSAGIKLNEAAAETVLGRAIVKGRSVVALPVEIDRPRVTAADAASINTLLSRFTTSFNPAKRDRTHNLHLAAAALNGKIIKPQAIFSVNEQIGPRLTERGYRSAPIFVRGNLEPGVGGGVCQVASTLYNAALLAGLKIVERSHHSRLVPYVSAGRDATVNYGHIDLKIQNSNANPIAIIASIKGSLLTVDIYGSASDKKQVSVYTSKPSYSAAGLKTVIDPKLAPGTKKVVDPGSPRVSVTVYRRIIQADGKAKTEVVSRDTYPAQSRIVALGPTPKNTNAAAPTPNTQTSPEIAE